MELEYFEYKGKTYLMTGALSSKNSQTREWESHITYQDDEYNTYSRDAVEFYERFKPVKKPSTEG